MSIEGRTEKEILGELKRINATLLRIECALARNRQHYTVKVTNMAIGDITAGGTGTFSAVLELNGVAVATTPTFTWSASDSTVTLAPSADTTSVVVTVPASDTGTSLTVTATTTAPDGTTPSGAATVTLTPSTTPQVFTVSVTQTA